MYSHHQTKKIISLPKLLLTAIFLSTLLSYSFLAFNSNSQEETPSLAEKVFEKYQTFLQREDIKALLPVVLVEIKKPENQRFLIPETINLAVDNPEFIKTLIPDIGDEFITLLKEDEEIQTFLRDPDVQALLQDLDAIDELEELLRFAELSLAERVAETHAAVFEREDIKELLPTILATFRKTDIQNQITPEILKSVETDPDTLKTILPNIDERFITLLKDDMDVMTFYSDPTLQLLLQDPEAIDELATILNINLVLPVTVKVSPASIESPRRGEQLTITVDIVDGQDVQGYEGVLSFDPTALRFVSLEHGTYLQGELLTVPTPEVTDRVRFAQISVDTPASTADGTLVTIKFEVLSAKASELLLTDVIISKAAGVQLPVIIENAEITEPPIGPWDTNGDGNVNILDLTFVASHIGNDDAPPEADVNGDGSVNILDLTLVAGHFGE
ncbi:hypothetical protein F4X73_05795 [Candidatus Poribacteria bacterium]|nr:hypothetical protein [Candidatus Poribacteria bacterium]MYF56521.1 hypothetical protein [Candidatus Poribacteria bacterium]